MTWSNSYTVTRMAHIDRAVVAQVLETAPVNVRRTQRMQHNGQDIILVALWSQKEKLTISVDQYQKAVKSFYGTGTVNGMPKMTWSTALVVGGILLGVYGLGMNTSVQTRFGDGVSNLSLMQQQNMYVFIGGTMVVVGVLVKKKE
jgi:hypothetical protein